MKILTFIFGFLVTILMQLTAQPVVSNSNVASSSSVIQHSDADINYVRYCFEQVERFFDLNKYDSAQCWLNIIHEKLPVKQPDVLNYFLRSRQAEVYYYNDLHQLGMQESVRALKIAQALQDSFLTADAHNFMGLFYLSMDSNYLAARHFGEAIALLPAVPAPETYYAFSSNYHMYGNKAEAYMKLGWLDSAKVAAVNSFNLAANAGVNRSMAIALNSLAEIYTRSNQPDSSKAINKKALAISRLFRHADAELVCHAGLATTYAITGQADSVTYYVQSGLQLLGAKNAINNFFRLFFFNDAIAAVKSIGNKSLLLQLYDSVNNIQAKALGDHNSQLEIVLKAGVDNENRLLMMQVKEVEHKQQLAQNKFVITFISFMLVLAAFAGFYYYQKRKQELAKVREKISADLHDDIGAALSSLQIYASLANKSIDADPTKSKQLMQKIETSSQQLMENMSDMVWSMQPQSRESNTLDIQIRNHAAALLSEKDISFDINFDSSVESTLVSMVARKNILLMTKEAINNIAKHSEANSVHINMSITARSLIINIADDGKGFEVGGSFTGNGMYNIDRRIKDLGGWLDIVSQPGAGTRLKATIPVHTIKANIS